MAVSIKMENEKIHKGNQQEQEFKHIIRIANTDLDGNKQVYIALRKVKGINFMFSNAILNVTKIDKTKKAGYLTDEEVKKIDDIIYNPSKYNIPVWLFNRRKDYETGENKHLLSTDLMIQTDNDIKTLKKIKTYKGVRHIYGLPSRGQRTKAHFRKNKTMGVSKRRVKQGKKSKK